MNDETGKTCSCTCAGSGSGAQPDRLQPQGSSKQSDFEKPADLLGLREEGSDDDEADEIVAQPGGEVNFPDGLQDTLVHWNQQVQDGTLYVAFNSIQNRNTEYFVAGSDTVQVTGYGTTESTGILEFKVALWELSEDKGNHFLCGGHHGVFPDRRGVQHLYHLRLDPRQAVQGQRQL